jgi:hypothetical protein
MEGPDALIQALREEDRRLRDLLGRFPAAACERQANGLPSCKETLADIAFWDACAVRIFRDRLAGRRTAPPPEVLAQQNREQMQHVRGLAFEEVLNSYADATGDLIDFLQACWDKLKPKYRRQFTLPLRHRRHHRELLESLLAEIGDRAAAHG